MPKDHARKKSLSTIKDSYGVKHTDAIALLESEDCEELCDLLATYSDVRTYQEAVTALQNRRDDPRNQLLCEDCGWTVGDVCPECAKGCGCEYSCSGWRHREMRAATGDYDEDDPDNGVYCHECGAGSSSPYDECVCDCDEEEAAA
ncbi:hypothetical protein [Streptomyces antarcticus]|uniref:hypothetical protein n=1 Tax=Streptomyces antarcticus TaxID=2996458 RepID=UPI0022718C94|nr:MULTISPECIES: hypothetical protein [unclassified Streptomyces]MCY0947294.1 hypothetical protein [Streptomyces sp. H34-AA3]MCZ4086539.1 hypothetical protein [Streptomyces sp. H34-S5]